MTIRSLVAILFSLIVAVEIFIYVSDDPGTRMITSTEKIIDQGSNTIGGFSRFNDDKVTEKHTTSIDYSVQRDWQTKFIVIIASTILVGGVLTFSVPNKKIKPIEAD